MRWINDTNPCLESWWRLSEERCCISIGSSWVGRRCMMKGDAFLVVVESCVVVVINMMRKLLLGDEGTGTPLLLLTRMIMLFPSWLRTSWNEHSCPFALSSYVILLMVHLKWCCWCLVVFSQQPLFLNSKIIIHIFSLIKRKRQIKFNLDKPGRQKRRVR